MRYRHIFALSTSAFLSLAAAAPAAITPSGGGLTLVQEGPLGNPVPSNLATTLGTPFSDGALQPAGQHDTPKLNDGVYGNANSWISDADPDGWAGISFAASQTLEAIAFGRDNLGTFSDRFLGTYTLQYRIDGLVDDTPGNWTTVGTIAYATGTSGLEINAPAYSQRHAFNFTPVAAATAVRLVVPGGAADTAIDEIELYSSALPPSSGSSLATISWDGNDGAHFNQSVPNNLALVTNGGTAFSDGEFGSGHLTANLNNGSYGNSQSWISDGDGDSFAGIDLGTAGGGLYALTSLAFGRDNRDIASGDNYDGDDRNLGNYSLQFTLLINADASTAFTGDPTTGWANIGNLGYLSNLDTSVGGLFTSKLRHEYQIGAIGGGPLVAGGIRILAPNGNAIDEIEIYGVAVPEPSSLLMLALGCVALFGFRRR